MRAPRHLRRGATRLLAAATVATVIGLGSVPAGADPLPIDVPVPTVTVPPLPAPTDGSKAEAARPAAAPQPLVGTFGLTAGACTNSMTGSYFRMIQPGDGSGFVQNADSPCTDKTYTPMAPGTDGGLVTGSHQPEPDPAFNATGGGLAARITKPQKFFGVDFASATNPTDPQTDTRVAAPTITHDGNGGLTGDLRAFGASWNNQNFNQGAPKPDGSTPGSTKKPVGTFDPTTGAYSIEWTSQIVGGSFNGFTGLWHFEGTFASSQASPTSTPRASAVADPSTPGTPAPTSGGSAPSGPASSGGVSAATDAAAGNPLALTGPTFSTLPGLFLLAAGAGGLTVVGRVRRRLAFDGTQT